VLGGWLGLGDGGEQIDLSGAFRKRGMEFPVRRGGGRRGGRLGGGGGAVVVGSRGWRGGVRLGGGVRRCAGVQSGGVAAVGERRGGGRQGRRCLDAFFREGD
jgi:hypothetical protein